MSDIKPFMPTTEYVKEYIKEFTLDGKPAECTDLQAQAVLNNWYTYLDESFYQFIKDEFMEGEIFNPEEEESDE